MLVLIVPGYTRRESGRSVIESPHFVCDSPEMARSSLSKLSPCCGRAPCSRRASAVPGVGVSAIPSSAIPASARSFEGRCRLAVDGRGRPSCSRQATSCFCRRRPLSRLSGFEPVTPGHRSEHRAAPRGRFATAPPTEIRCPPARRLLHFRFRDADCWCRCCRRGARARYCRLSVLVRLVGEEASGQRAGRDLVLARLVEVLLIEALRATQRRGRASGIAARAGRCAARGGDTADARRSRARHGPWLSLRGRPHCPARHSSTGSRATSGCRRWNTCLPGAWPLRKICSAARHRDRRSCRRVGYGSASTFSTAFSRYVGQPPGRYAREKAA